MKKAFLLVGMILLSLLIFIGMPYCLLKSSLLHDCNKQTTTCNNTTIQHQLSRTNSEHEHSNTRDSYILEKVSTSTSFEHWLANH
ncbi:hypothetical protein [Rummeliibacillus pycnus]|uniref:hypothetical protein n=1 Tax=Rummeliibacillus pycnus TaxID=101070 RepID=UPI000C9D0CE1|nr:hypothetical protein [Rummeliibacillus pycnus]